MDHFSPHPGVTFEGYYSKFRLPSGSSIALIISAVPGAAREATSATKGKGKPSQMGEEVRRRKAFMVSFTYVSADSSQHWQREYWPEKFDVQLLRSGQPARRDSESKHGFTMSWDTGEFSWRSNSADGSVRDCVKWRLETDEVTFMAETVVGEEGYLDGKSRIPWEVGDESSTPAGLLARTPLPIQWHVHSLESPCRFQLDIKPVPGRDDDETTARVHPLDKQENDHSPLAYVHTEKNWALTFPESYIWIQARDHEKGQGVCLAGGTLFRGVQAYLVGYEGERSISFKPPTSTSILSLSLGLHPEVSYPNRSVTIDIKGWFRRLHLHASVPDSDKARASSSSSENISSAKSHSESKSGSLPSAFFTFAAPLATGHAPNYCAQSFGADIEVKVYERKWLGKDWSLWSGGWGWEEVERRRWERGSLEFGGGFYRQHEE